MLTQFQLNEAHKEAARLFKKGVAFKVPTVFEKCLKNCSSFESIRKICEAQHQECRHEMTRLLELQRQTKKDNHAK